MRRAAQLSHGQFWRVFGISLLATMAAYFVGQLVAIPFVIIGVVLMFVLPGSWGFVALLLATYLSAVVTGAITSPFIGGVTALQYYDQRFRKEGHDIELLDQACVSPVTRRARTRASRVDRRRPRRAVRAAGPRSGHRPRLAAGRAVPAGVPTLAGRALPGMGGRTCFDGVRGASEAIGGFNPVLAVGALALLIAARRVRPVPPAAPTRRLPTVSGPSSTRCRLLGRRHRDLARRAVELRRLACRGGRVDARARRRDCSNAASSSRTRGDGARDLQRAPDAPSRRPAERPGQRCGRLRRDVVRRPPADEPRAREVSAPRGVDLSVGDPVAGPHAAPVAVVPR